MKSYFDKIMRLPWVHNDIDLSQCRSCDDIHAQLKKVLELPNFYGCNLAALWDCVTGMMAIPADITVRGVSNLPLALQREAFDTIEVFKDAEVKYEFIRVHVID